MNDRTEPSLITTKLALPSTRLSARAETMPDMCEVYRPTASRAPAFTAPAIKQSVSRIIPLGSDDTPQDFDEPSLSSPVVPFRQRRSIR
jgi:hypothetical protein